jgi:hypothetical protein
MATSGTTNAEIQTIMWFLFSIIRTQYHVEIQVKLSVGRESLRKSYIRKAEVRAANRGINKSKVIDHYGNLMFIIGGQSPFYRGIMDAAVDLYGGWQEELR